MKVLLVNILYKERSTGRICSEVKKTLEDKGHTGFAAYGKGMHNEKNTYPTLNIISII
jgi:hypothetical protein